MKAFRPALFIMGIILIMLSILMVVPVLFLFWLDTSNWVAFTTSASITLVIGSVLALSFRSRDQFANIQNKQLFLITIMNWFGVSAFSTLPFILCTDHFSITDAVFESVSGVTTTGSTVLSGLDSMPMDIILWRSLLQWLGGIGIIGMAIAVLPYLQVGGMRLFKTESSNWYQKSHPRAQQAAKALVFIYILLTVLCAMAYLLAGMSFFEAVNHAMTTLSTGGYSTSDSSMGHFTSPYILWSSIVFMMLGGMPFLIYIRFLKTFRLQAFRDDQVRGFIVALGSLSLVLTIYLIASPDYGNFEALTHATFNVVSIVTTTGYASTDYSLWGQFSVVLFFFMTFVGGCSGSTSGGMKIFRFQLSYLILKEQFKRYVHPRVILKRYYNGHIVGDDIITSAIAFTYIFLITLAIITLLLTLQGLDFLTSISASATALANVGPGLGEIIGPAGNFQSLPAPTKWILAFGMLAGRLELMTVFVVFTRQFWKV